MYLMTSRSVIIYLSKLLKMTYTHFFAYVIENVNIKNVDINGIWINKRNTIL